MSLAHPGTGSSAREAARPIARQELAELRRRLLAHPLYARVTRLPDLRTFMREHVFAVWDFMSLLKRMQLEVTTTTLPWLPLADAESARLIQEIVLGEECDEDGRGGFNSHFELYLAAMDELQAETGPIRQFVADLRRGVTWPSALAAAKILPETRRFVQFSLQLATQGAAHEVAAAFFYGREDIIPEMFSRLVDTLRAEGAQHERLRHYLLRHIELDGDQHGPLAEKLLRRLCGDDPCRLAEAEETACRALEARLALWDGILRALSRAEVDAAEECSAAAPSRSA